MRHVLALWMPAIFYSVYASSYKRAYICACVCISCIVACEYGFGFVCLDCIPADKSLMVFGIELQIKYHIMDKLKYKRAIRSAIRCTFNKANKASEMYWFVVVPPNFRRFVCQARSNLREDLELEKL